MADDIEVEVHVPTPETEPVTESPDVVVVESGDSGSVDGATVAVISEQSARIAALEAELEASRNSAADAQLTADSAAAVASEALAETEEVVSEVAAMIAEAEPKPDAENDVEPSREHWFWR